MFFKAKHSSISTPYIFLRAKRYIKFTIYKNIVRDYSENWLAVVHITHRIRIKYIGYLCIRILMDFDPLSPLVIRREIFAQAYHVIF